MDVVSVLKEIERLPQKEKGQVYLSALKPLMQKIGRNHNLAIQLWDTGDENARELAVRVADPKQADNLLLEIWVKDLKTWMLTDSFTGHLVKYTTHAVEKSYEWVERESEFERRAGFATVAQMAWSKDDVQDDVFISFLPCIEAASDDDRLYVKKAVNWALRDIGKRNEKLRTHAQSLALKLQKSDNKTMRWIGTHRFREIMMSNSTQAL